MASEAQSPPPKTAELAPALHRMGFEIEDVSADVVTGRLVVTESCCQPFKVLEGGVSALISESLASMGAHVASGFRRVAGVQLSINHHRSARLGDLVVARAAPVQVGRTVQPFGMLHGGISALVAEALASTGAFVASGFRPVSGIQLSINHHRSSSAGGHVFARAAPVQVGKTIQVWEVCLYKMDPISSEKGDLISSARVTLLVNLPVPANAQNAGDALKKYARL